jgi:hypothetical protein
MKIVKSFFVFNLLIFFVLNTVVAQKIQPTPYQKRLLELSKKYFEIFYGQKFSMTDEVFFEQIAQGKEVQEFLLAIGIMDYATKHSKAQCEKIFTQMKNEYKQAEKLKNANDLKLEQEVQARKLQLQKESKLRAERDAYEKTSVGLIQKKIKSEFIKWNQKGEFEKEAEYIERLKIKSIKAFEEICITQIENEISKNEHTVRLEIAPYNSESEYFVINCEIKGFHLQGKLNIPISKAQEFKNNFMYFDREISKYDWCFIGNSLCPTMVTLKYEYDNSNYIISLSPENQTEITFSFDVFEIENKYLKGYIFKYSNAKIIKEEIEKEKERLDSIALATYNNRLDSIFNDYNSRLLNNKYNLNKVILSNYDRITRNIDAEFYFDNEASKMKSEFETLNNNFIRIRNNQYGEYGSFFSEEKEFDSFYFKGTDALQTEVERRSIIIFLKANSQIIESIDFQKGKKESFGSALGKRVLNFPQRTNTAERESTKENEERNDILSIINECKNKSYYFEVLDLVIATNKALNKEWIKNGQYFENISEFYDAYLSEDYKKILKEKMRN